MTLVFIAVLAALLFIYLAIPLLLPGQSDALPDPRDPVTQDLEEERDALLRAIRELDARTDLPAARRDALRSRYEAKAAKVLRALDERHEQVPPIRVYDASKTGARTKRLGLPLAALSLLGVGLSGAAWLANTTPPEVVTADGSAPVLSGRELGSRERAAERDPSEENLLALADGYWQVENGERAKAVYQRVVSEVSPVPAVAYQRLGFLGLQEDVSEALRYLELARSADPENLQTLYFLGEVYYANQDMAAATEAWKAIWRPPAARMTKRYRGGWPSPAPTRRCSPPSSATLPRLTCWRWQTATGRIRSGAAPSTITFSCSAKTTRTTRLRSAASDNSSFSEVAMRTLSPSWAAPVRSRPTICRHFCFSATHTSAWGNTEKLSMCGSVTSRRRGGPDRAGRVPSLIADARERLRTGAPPPAADTSNPDAPPETAGTPAPVNIP